MYPVIHALQKPGEIMFVPSGKHKRHLRLLTQNLNLGWWHVVMNLDCTIAVTQNFCSITNLPIVWPKTVKGRPKLSTHWLRSLRANRPEIARIIEESNQNANWSAMDDSSSDSSSSSSSDSDSDSSDDETSLQQNGTAVLSNGSAIMNGVRKR